MIEKLNLQPAKLQTGINSVKSLSPAEVSEQFSAFLNNAINDLNNQQAAVNSLNTKFIKGETSDVHQLMIASEKASLGLELTVQVRNKVIEAYQEIMRIQV